MMELSIENGRLFLDGMKLSGVSHYHIEIDSTFPNGKANLKIDMCVSLPENMRLQNLSPEKSPPEEIQ
jgi:hypothetical protein